jgi:hypothetical protein
MATTDTCHLFPQPQEPAAMVDKTSSIEPNLSSVSMNDPMHQSLCTILEEDGTMTEQARKAKKFHLPGKHIKSLLFQGNLAFMLLTVEWTPTLLASPS